MSLCWSQCWLLGSDLCTYNHTSDLSFKSYRRHVLHPPDASGGGSPWAPIWFARLRLLLLLPAQSQPQRCHPSPSHPLACRGFPNSDWVERTREQSQCSASARGCCLCWAAAYIFLERVSSFQEHKSNVTMKCPRGVLHKIQVIPSFVDF